MALLMSLVPQRASGDALSRNSESPRGPCSLVDDAGIVNWRYVGSISASRQLSGFVMWDI